MRTSLRRAPVAAAVLAVLTVTACSGQQPEQQDRQPQPSPTSSAGPSSAPSSSAGGQPPREDKQVRPTENPADPPLAPQRRPQAEPPKQTVKRVETAAACRGLVTPAELGAATGTRASAAPGSGPGDCSFNLRGGGDGFSQVVITERRAGIGGTIRQTTVAGNSATEQDESDGRARSCTYRVRINGDPQLNTLMVNVLYFNSGKDACQAARRLAETAFPRLPNG